MRIHAATISFPPRRFIGAELMTARLLEHLVDVGHQVTVNVGDGAGDWTWRGIPVTGNALNEPRHPNVVIVHAGRSWPGVELRARTGAQLVMICHNTSEGVVDDLAGARPDLVVVNSQAMADELGLDALIINPPAPPIVDQRAGDRVLTMSLNKPKGGEYFWALAARMPDVEFLAVRGGYGDQVAGDLENVELLEHVPHDDLDDVVWSNTGVYLQLAKSESWGMAASEAIAHGIPVIAHPTPGILENLDDAATYVDRTDVDALAGALREILANPAPHIALARRRALEHQAASAAQLTDWVTAIERLGDGQANQRDRSEASVVGRL